MEHIKFTCDIKNREHSELVSRKKVPVMFDYDQDDGKSQMTPYFEMKDIDICERCFNEMTEKRILIYAYGVMGYNDYSF
jgi:hydrogenase maturation factor HypF (carbamoyltransferase family)